MYVVLTKNKVKLTLKLLAIKFNIETLNFGSKTNDFSWLNYLINILKWTVFIPFNYIK